MSLGYFIYTLVTTQFIHQQIQQIQEHPKLEANMRDAQTGDFKTTVSREVHTEQQDHLQ